MSGLIKALTRLWRKLACRHEFRESRSWPGTKVCVHCGARRGRPHLVL